MPKPKMDDSREGYFDEARSHADTDGQPGRYEQAVTDFVRADRKNSEERERIARNDRKAAKRKRRLNSIQASAARKRALIMNEGI